MKVYSLLLLLIVVFSCNGQNKMNQEDKITGSAGTLKILKPEGLFKDAAIGCGLCDKAGNLWFGSNGEGVYRYNARLNDSVGQGKTFTHFTMKDGLDNNIVYSMLEDKSGNIWVGTKTGLCRYNARLNNSVGQGKTFIQCPIIATDRSQNGVWSMMEDRSGKIWFGTDAGVYYYQGNGFTRFPDNNNIINKDSLHLKAIFSIVEDKKGNIWFGSCIGEGIIRFDGKTVSRISPKGYARTQYIVEDKSGNIWFGSIGKGMCRYDARLNDSVGQGKTINTNFFKEKNTRDLLYMIWKDKAGNLWFCEPFYNRALRYYDGNENINFAEKDNLPDKKIYPVVQDNKGNIWFVSFGMKLYSFDGKAFTDFSE